MGVYGEAVDGEAMLTSPMANTEGDQGFTGNTAAQRKMHLDVLGFCSAVYIPSRFLGAARKMLSTLVIH